MVRFLVVGLFVTSEMIAATATPSVTFNKDVLPVLQKQCQTCHRPGQVAPMSFLTYKDTRPWAQAVKTAILTRKMPPWFADRNYGHFTNERKLSEAEVKTLVAWVDGGALEGDAKDAPPPVHFTEGWTIGEPDIVIQFPHAIAIPATGAIDQSNLLVKVNFPKDLWVKAAEVRPGNPKAVHTVRSEPGVVASPDECPWAATPDLQRSIGLFPACRWLYSGIQSPKGTRPTGHPRSACALSRIVTRSAGCA
jgi:hypothetical protein